MVTRKALPVDVAGIAVMADSLVGRGRFIPAIRSLQALLGKPVGTRAVSASAMRSSAKTRSAVSQCRRGRCESPTFCSPRPALARLPQ